MNIGVALSTDKGLVKAVFTEEQMILDLIKALKAKGTEEVVLTTGIYKVDGIYIPGKGNKSVIMILPNIAED